MNWYDCSLLSPMEIQNLIEGTFREKISILEVEQWYSNRKNEFVGSIDDGMFFVLDVMTDAMLTFPLRPFKERFSACLPYTSIQIVKEGAKWNFVQRRSFMRSTSWGL